MVAKRGPNRFPGRRVAPKLTHPWSWYEPSPASKNVLIFAGVSSSVISSFKKKVLGQKKILFAASNGSTRIALLPRLDIRLEYSIKG
jgi:hypothetical protein